MNFVGYNNKTLSFVLTVEVTLECFSLESIAGLNNISHFNFGSHQNIRFCQETFMFPSVNKFINSHKVSPERDIHSLKSLNLY